MLQRHFHEGMAYWLSERYCPLKLDLNVDLRSSIPVTGTAHEKENKIDGPFLFCTLQALLASMPPQTRASCRHAHLCSKHARLADHTSPFFLLYTIRQHDIVFIQLQRNRPSSHPPISSLLLSQSLLGLSGSVELRR
jgi:hypothetical protein